MEFKKLGLLGIAAMLAITGTATVHASIVEVMEPNYFVRPVLRIGDGELIEGIELNGATESTNEQGVVGYSSSTVNLNEGTVKMYAEEFAPATGLQTFGSFGERITVTNGAGTDWSLGFDVEGFLDTFAGAPIINGVTEPTIYYDVGIAVYRAGQVTWNNFVNNPDFEPLLFEFEQIVDPIDNLSEFSSVDVFASVAGSITLESDYEQFDIFAFTNVIVNSEDGDGLDSYVSDFTNTASFSQTFANGVEAFSSSGQFLGLTTPPPPPVNQASAPAGLALLGFGFAMLAFRRKQKN